MKNCVFSSLRSNSLWIGVFSYSYRLNNISFIFIYVDVTKSNVMFIKVVFVLNKWTNFSSLIVKEFSDFDSISEANVLKIFECYFVYTNFDFLNNLAAFLTGSQFDTGYTSSVKLLFTPHSIFVLIFLIFKSFLWCKKLYIFFFSFATYLIPIKC